VNSSPRRAGSLTREVGCQFRRRDVPDGSVGVAVTLRRRTHGTAAIDRESGPDPPWGGRGYIGPGPCSLGGAEEHVVICARIDRAARWRPFSIVRPNQALARRGAQGDDPGDGARQTPDVAGADPEVLKYAALAEKLWGGRRGRGTFIVPTN
jgi:hypothetical protein